MVTSVRNMPPVQQPDRRRLRTFAFDPMSTRLSGSFLRVDVPYEAGLKPGPLGGLVHVVDFDASANVWYSPVDLNDPAILAQDGLVPSEGDPRTHQQVVYAVTMSVIERVERFTGRRFRWRGQHALKLVPHAFEGRNAFFDPTRGAVLFGYYRADRNDPGRNLPGQVMFTCLSADVVAHEVTHAIVHRLRRYFSEATNADVFAWHEAFADLVALFQHFAHPEVVEEAVAANQGDLRTGGGLLELAREFGESTGRGAALRSAVRAEPDPARFRALTEPHERGAEFVAGVFDAYLTTYQARIADLLRIATNGTGVLPPGAIHPDLVARVAGEAVRHADRILGMVVRAFDYLPVVDPMFGDVLRAIVTADRRLHADDDAHLRSTLVESLRRRGIFPSDVASLTDDGLAWRSPGIPLTLAGHDPELDIAGVILSATQNLDVGGPIGWADDDDEDGAARGVSAGRDPARLDGPFVEWATAHAYELGLEPSMGITLRDIHVAYRQAADRQPRPELVLQFSQRRLDLEDTLLPEDQRPAIRAGTTVIARVDGTVEYVVAKTLPFTDPAALDALDPALGEVARGYHDAGVKRLARLRSWFDDIEDRDPLSAWTMQPAQLRMTFANLHAGIDDGGA